MGIHRCLPIAVAGAVCSLSAPARADDLAVDPTRATQSAQTPALKPVGPNEPAAPVSATTTPRRPHGAYGAPETKLTTLTGDAAVLVGGQAGWILDRSVIIGAAGYGLATTHTPVAELQRPYGRSRIELGYGGPRFGYVYRPASLVHFAAGVLVGAGGLRIATYDPAGKGGDGGYDHHDGMAFFVLEPQLEAEVNLARHVRLALGGSYRYIESTGKPGLRTSDLSGPAASFAVKMGVF